MNHCSFHQSRFLFSLIVALAATAGVSASTQAENGSTIPFAPGTPDAPEWLRLAPPLALPLDTGRAPHFAALRETLRPLSLCAGDLDEDGAPDLFAGYASSGRKFILR